MNTKRLKAEKKQLKGIIKKAKFGIEMINKALETKKSNKGKLTYDELKKLPHIKAAIADPVHDMIPENQREEILRAYHSFYLNLN